MCCDESVVGHDVLEGEGNRGAGPRDTHVDLLRLENTGARWLHLGRGGATQPRRKPGAIKVHTIERTLYAAVRGAQRLTTGALDGSDEEVLDREAQIVLTTATEQQEAEPEPCLQCVALACRAVLVVRGLRELTEKHFCVESVRRAFMKKPERQQRRGLHILVEVDVECRGHQSLNMHRQTFVQRRVRRAARRCACPQQQRHDRGVVPLAERQQSVDIRRRERPEMARETERQKNARAGNAALHAPHTVVHPVARDPERRTRREFQPRGTRVVEFTPQDLLVLELGGVVKLHHDFASGRSEDHVGDRHRPVLLRLLVQRGHAAPDADGQNLLGLLPQQCLRVRRWVKVLELVRDRR
eukprot:PhM_4_TR10860/c0_g1_i1/m.70948